MDDLNRILALAGLPTVQPQPLFEAQLQEKSPQGWEGTVKAMKRHKDIDNPWALSHWMKNRGAHSHYTKGGKKKKHESAGFSLDAVVERVLRYLAEKWDSDYETPDSKKGMWDGCSKGDLEKKRSALRNKDERSDAESTKLKQINFALRAKSDWGDVPE